MAQTNPPKLDAREEHFRIPSPHGELSLFLRYLPALRDSGSAKKSRFTSMEELFRWDCRSPTASTGSPGAISWRHPGIIAGGSTSTASVASRILIPRCPSRPICTLRSAAPMTQAVSSKRPCVSSAPIIACRGFSLIAHSWGSIVCGRFAGERPRLVERMVLFGPIAWRERRADPQRLAAWRLISLKDQWDRFVADVPPGEPPVLSKAAFR